MEVTHAVQADPIPISRRADQGPGKVSVAGLDLHLLSSTEQFARLAPVWNELLAQSRRANIFLTWEWLWTWWEVFGNRLRPWVLVAEDPASGQIVGVAPFALRRFPLPGGPFRELSLMGTWICAGDHLDVICRADYEAAAMGRFSQALAEHRQEWDLLTLDRVAWDSPLLTLLRGPVDRPAMRWESLCPFIRAPGGWESLYSTLTKNTRRNLRKQSAALARDTPGKVEYRQVRSVEEVPAAMDELFRLHQQLWEARGERGCFHTPAIRRFHRRLAERCAHKGTLRLYLLQAGGRTIAAEYDFLHHHTVYMYQSGFDRQWAAYSPGTLLTGHAIRSAIEEGATEIDLLRGAEPYKAIWTRLARKDARVRVATTPLGGLLVRTYRSVYAARHRLRRWRGTECRAAEFAETGTASQVSDGVS